MFHDMTHSWGFHGVGMLLWLVAIVVVIWLVVKMSQKPGGSAQETPLDILKKRYAKGDITQEEFEQKKKELQ